MEFGLECKRDKNLFGKKMKRKLKNILVTGGAGFIGSHFIDELFFRLENKTLSFSKAVNVDCLTYAGNKKNNAAVEKKYGGKRYFFEKVNVCDEKKVLKIFRDYNIDTVVNFAAETHVDKSIENARSFVNTNVQGTFVLLECAKKFWQTKKGITRRDVLFHQISTDEVFGALEKGCAKERAPYNPTSPYAATKAASDFLVQSFWKTYGLPVTISHSSNNFGPRQFPEKFIPLAIESFLQEKKMPLYGNGEQKRDWIFVKDNVAAVILILQKGIAGERYNIASGKLKTNNEVLRTIIKLLSKKMNVRETEFENLIESVKDRLSHDVRYAMNCEKIHALGWSAKISFEDGMREIIYNV